MRRIAILAVLGAIGVLLVALASPASAGRPSFNPVCLGAKIEGGQSGVYEMTFGDVVGSITITVVETDMGPELSFDTGNVQHVVGWVDVKGGTALNTYSFLTDATPNGVSSASGLHAELNPTSGKWYGISYLCFGTGFDDGAGGEGGEGGEFGE